MQDRKEPESKVPDKKELAAYFTKDELVLLDMARDKIASASRERLKNPIDFDLNIAFCRELMKATRIFGDVVEPHVIAMKKAQSSAKKSFFSYFAKQAHDRALREKTILELSKNYIVNVPEFKESFKNEPRIKDINVGFNHSERELYRRDKLVSATTTDTETYTFTFADDTTFVLNSLSNEEVQQFKIKYMEKMDQLAQKNSSVLSMLGFK